MSVRAADVLSDHAEWVKRRASSKLRARADELARSGLPEDEIDRRLVAFHDELLADAKEQIALATLRLSEPNGRLQ